MHQAQTEPGRNITQRLPTLDGIRGLAAVAVLFFHAHLDLFGRAFSHGDSAVDLFFLLSGFVLTVSFEPRMREGLGTEAFVRLRLKRFLPMVVMGAILGGIAYAPITPPVGLAVSIVCAALMIPALASSALYPVNPPQWSLLLELIANAAHALFLYRLGTRRLIAFCGLCLATYLYGATHPGDGPLGTMSGLEPMLLARIGWSYTIGVLFARAWRKRIGASLRVDWRLALLLPFAVIVSMPYLPISITLANALCVLLVFPALFWLAVHAAPPSSVERGLTLLGAISFPLYATHFPVLIMAVQLGGEPARGIGTVAALILALAIVAFQPHLAAALVQLRSARRDGTRSASKAGAFKQN